MVDHDAWLRAIQQQIVEAIVSNGAAPTEFVLTYCYDAHRPKTNRGVCVRPIGEMNICTIALQLDGLVSVISLHPQGQMIRRLLNLGDPGLMDQLVELARQAMHERGYTTRARVERCIEHYRRSRTN